MKKLLSFIITLISVMLMGIACTEKIELDVKQASPVYIVDALLTNQLKRHTVSVTKSVGFYEVEKYPVVKNAVVTVEDNCGSLVKYYFDDETNTYMPEEPFMGRIGYVYKLNIEIDGSLVTASDTLKRVTKIDQLKSYFDEDEYRIYHNKDKEKGPFYKVAMDAKEPKDTKDFYQMRVYCRPTDDTVGTNYKEVDVGILVIDDARVVDNIKDFPIPSWFSKGYDVAVELYSLTPSAYKFYKDLNSLLEGDGGMFGPIPANPKTNLKGGQVYGVFQVSAVESRSVTVGEKL